MCAPYGLSHFIFLGSQLFTDGLGDDAMLNIVNTTNQHFNALIVQGIIFKLYGTIIKGTVTGQEVSVVPVEQ